MSNDSVVCPGCGSKTWSDEWHKPDCPADALEAKDREIERLTNEWARECNHADIVLIALGMPIDQYRTEGGSMNLPKITSVLRERMAEAERLEQLIRRYPHLPCGAVLREWLGSAINTARAGGEITRLTREVERLEALLRENCGGAPAPLGWFYRVRTALARAGGEQT